MPFHKYSSFYDLLYSDKDYKAEAQYVARIIRNSIPHARTILELGSGTGRHGRLLAELGFDVYGVEQSSEMVSIAAANNCRANAELSGSFQCQVGDISTVSLGRAFDAVVSLFHVISYQTSNEGLQATFRVAANHLALGGLFLFDVWHGPAVLCQRPSQRTKEVADDRYRVKRVARPELDANRGTVKVLFEMNWEDLLTGERGEFSEEHLIRYLFPAEIDSLARSCAMRQIATEEILTGAEPSPSTWGVTYVLQK